MPILAADQNSPVMMKSILTSIAVVFVFSAVLSGQEIAWERPCGDKQDDVITKVFQMSNGWGVGVGFTQVPGSLQQQGLLVIVDLENGSIINQYDYGESGTEALFDVVQLQDGTLVAVGYSSLKENERKNAWLLQIDLDGKVIKSKIWESPTNDAFKQIVLRENGTLYIGGYKGGEKDGKPWLVCLTDRMEKDKEIVLNLPNFWSFQGMAIAPERGILICSVHEKNENKAKNISATLLNWDLVSIWQQTYSSPYWQESNQVIYKENDQQFWLAGWQWINTNRKEDALIKKIDLTGAFLGDLIYGGNDKDIAWSIADCLNKGVVLAGSTKSHLIGARSFNAYLSWAEPVQGQSKPDFSWGKEKDEEVFSATPLYDGHLLTGGYSASAGMGQKDAWLSKIKLAQSVVPLQAKSPELNLSISEPRLQGDDNRNGILEPEERAAIVFNVTNKSQEDVSELKFLISADPVQQGIKFWELVYVGYIPSGQSKKISIPIKAGINLSPGTSRFLFKLQHKSIFVQSIGYNLLSRPVNTNQATIATPTVTVFWEDVLPLNGRSIRTINTPEFTIKAKAISTRTLQPTQFRVYQNGQLLENSKSIEHELYPQGTQDNRSFYQFYNKIKFEKAGVYEIRVAIFDENGNEVTTDPITIQYEPEKPVLHLLCIGPSYQDLQYTGKDAEDFARAFKQQEGGLFSRVNLRVLNERDNTSLQAIQFAFEDLKMAYLNPERVANPIKSNDVLIVFISAHGKYLEKGFSIVPTDFKPQYLTSYLDYKSGILDQLNQIKCKKMVFIDACHSGAAQGAKELIPNDEDMSSALQKLNRQIQGAAIIASCGVTERSFEDNRWENGAYTEAILEALSESKSPADANKDSIISLQELFQYVQKRVQELVANSKGRMVTQVPEMISDFKDDVPFFIVK